MSTKFNLQTFEAELSNLGCRRNREILSFNTIDSTSSELRRLLMRGGRPGTVAVADRQEAGRGRKGRSWHSPDSGNLYISVAAELVGPTRETVPMLPLAAGVAACVAIRGLTGTDARVKWPNDVLIADRKVAGILTEAYRLETVSHLAIVGLGVNVHSSPHHHPQELPRPPESCE